MTATVTAPAEAKDRARWWARCGLTAWSAALVLIGGLYAVQPDVLAAAVLVPVWCWCFMLAVWLILAHRERRVRLVGLACVLGLWCWHGEEPLALVHGLIPARDAGRPKVRRIDVFNCAGSTAAVREALKDRADLYLLQEVPGRENLEQAARRAFGGSVAVVASRDCAIVSPGFLEPLAVDARGRWVIARLNSRLAVASIRLEPPAPRLDFWTAGFWADHARVRRKHREEIGELLAVLKRVAPGGPFLMGGDFNAPATDAAWAELRHEAQDVFASAGRGWPHTATNDIPLFRVDLLWASPEVAPVWSAVQTSQHSDHRRVEAGIVLP